MANSIGNTKAIGKRDVAQPGGWLVEAHPHLSGESVTPDDGREPTSQNLDALIRP